MARMKLMARKHVCAPPHRNVVPTESHNDVQNASYFSRTLWTVLLALGSSEPPLFIETLRLLCGNSYIWHVRVVIYKRPMTDHICCIRQVVEAPTQRWTFEGGIRETAWEALVVLRHEADDQMVHLQYHQFLSWAEEGAKVVVLPARDHDCMGCFTDQVNLTHALVWDLDEAVKEVKLLGEHEEESSHKITGLEALCKKMRADTQRLEEEKVTLKGMIKSHDELLMEIARETGLDHMGEDDEDEEEDEDADDGEDAATPPAVAPPPPAPPATAPKEIDDEGPMEMVPEQEAPVSHEVILIDASPRCHSSVSTTHSWGTMMRARPWWWITLMIWMMTRMKVALTWMSGFSKMEVLIGIESSSLSLKFRFR
jgi:hypothetical protein